MSSVRETGGRQVECGQKAPQDNTRTTPGHNQDNTRTTSEREKEKKIDQKGGSSTVLSDLGSGHPTEVLEGAEKVERHVPEWARELVIASDCKHLAASDTLGTKSSTYATRRLWDGI